MKQLALVVVVTALVGGATALAKPTAPVQVRLESKPVAGGFEVTLFATPTADVPTLELDLGTHHAAFPATRTGQVRTLKAKFPLASGAGGDVVGSATVRMGKWFRNAPAMIHLGAPAPVEKRVETIRTLPDGTQILEVR